MIHCLCTTPPVVQQSHLSYIMKTVKLYLCGESYPSITSRGKSSLIGSELLSDGKSITMYMQNFMNVGTISLKKYLMPNYSWHVYYVYHKLYNMYSHMYVCITGMQQYAIYSSAIQYNTTDRVLHYNRMLQICCIFLSIS